MKTWDVMIHGKVFRVKADKLDWDGCLLHGNEIVAQFKWQNGVEAIVLVEDEVKESEAQLRAALTKIIWLAEPVGTDRGNTAIVEIARGAPNGTK